MGDFLSIVETPGALLNREQWERMALRYSLAAEMAAQRRVLEVACGAGVGLGLLLNRAQRLVACDLSPAALALARRNVGAHVTLSAADAQHLPFADDSFDLILCFETIYYLPAPETFFRECRRVLTAKGHLVLSTSNPDWPYFVPGAFSVYYPSVPELTALLRTSGFTAVQMFGSLPLDASNASRLRLTLRRLALQWNFLRKEHWLTRLLKRLGYGKLIALPPVLSEPHRMADPFRQLTPIAPDQRDGYHRVIIAIAGQSSYRY
ncbi:MAG: class I SAM-dependent methyltransferase [Caldilineales bacterium]|nr:class I SAM-dependent methyltransferase [Caldilineales bacterium]